MNFDNVVTGTKVWIEGTRLGERKRWWRSVLRRTRTQIVLADDFQTRFLRATGEQIGGLHDRIVAVATDAEVSAYEVEKAVRAARNTELEAEEIELRKLLEWSRVTLPRTKDRYELRACWLTPAQVRAMYAALKGAKGRL